MNVAGTTQLLFDDHIIASLAGATRRVHSPDFTHISLRADAEWERGFTIGIIGTSLVDDGATLRVWYSLRNASLVIPSSTPGVGPQPDYHAKPILTAYAESSDGVSASSSRSSAYTSYAARRRTTYSETGR